MRFMMIMIVNSNSDNQFLVSEREIKIMLNDAILFYLRKIKESNITKITEINSNVVNSLLSPDIFLIDDSFNFSFNELMKNMDMIS